MKTKKDHPIYATPTGEPCYIVDMREVQIIQDGNQVKQEIADVQIIGGMQPVGYQVRDLKPYDRKTFAPGTNYTDLAIEAVILYGADPARVTRAVDLLHANKWNVQLAKRDENGQPIKPNWNVYCVKGSKGWYVVRPGSCTCKDHQTGNVCKHRLAAWMYREAVTRPAAIARRTTPSVILAELMG